MDARKVIRGGLVIDVDLACDFEGPLVIEGTHVEDVAIRFLQQVEQTRATELAESSFCPSRRAVPLDVLLTAERDVFCFYREGRSTRPSSAHRAVAYMQSVRNACSDESHCGTQTPPFSVHGALSGDPTYGDSSDRKLSPPQRTLRCATLGRFGGNDEIRNWRARILMKFVLLHSSPTTSSVRSWPVISWRV